MIYLDAGTTYSKVIEVGADTLYSKFAGYFVEKKDDKSFYVVPSAIIKNSDIKVEKCCGHMGTLKNEAPAYENEIIALAQGCKNIVEEDSTILDLGSRDAKWIMFKNKKFHDMDWNTACASSTGATVEMLLKFYNVKREELRFNEERFVVTCGIFGLEKIMDDISNGEQPVNAISKFVHGIAYNAWSFSKKPKKIYLSGGFCDNECFVESLRNYCDVELLGRFMLCEGLING